MMHNLTYISDGCFEIKEELQRFAQHLSWWKHKVVCGSLRGFCQSEKTNLMISYWCHQFLYAPAYCYSGTNFKAQSECWGIFLHLHFFLFWLLHCKLSLASIREHLMFFFSSLSLSLCFECNILNSFKQKDISLMWSLSKNDKCSFYLEGNVMEYNLI